MVTLMGIQTGSEQEQLQWDLSHASVVRDVEERYRSDPVGVEHGLCRYE